MALQAYSTEALENTHERGNVELLNLLPQGPLAYQDVWDLQRHIMQQKIQHLKDPEGGQGVADTLVLVEHRPVYTLGTGSTVDNLKFDMSTPPQGFDMFRVERGGEVTYHGPGQVVLYPILNLRGGPPLQADLHWYLRQLEEVVIHALGEMGVSDCTRQEGLTGVWKDGRKLAAIGVKVSRWVTMHGLALNICPDMSHFRNIVPCGISDRPVACVRDFNPDTNMSVAGQQLVKSFSRIFNVDVSIADSSKLPVGGA
eukprot:CAMPEP_0113936558 /NCGR_PEP_ID=MMETSP1339-20121228/3447_1 /TAXON_ID=94617 /ORGANISM="Fibrocapsa japonica" /LENGTH=255 /DNA_ID=CAMNT_0000939077 /DNA_START=209 /DNA_END=976 /DNA_ORIENTATION=+ /assembly_acc=CAM_ASM_000762